MRFMHLVVLALLLICLIESVDVERRSLAAEAILNDEVTTPSGMTTVSATDDLPATKSHAGSSITTSIVSTSSTTTITSLKPTVDPKFRDVHCGTETHHKAVPYCWERPVKLDQNPSKSGLEAPTLSTSFETICTVVWHYAKGKNNVTDVQPYNDYTPFIPQEIGKLPFYGSSFTPVQTNYRLSNFTKCGYKIPTYDSLCEPYNQAPYNSSLLFVCDFAIGDYRAHEAEIFNNSSSLLNSIFREFQPYQFQCASTKCELWNKANNFCRLPERESYGYGWVDYNVFMEIGHNFTEPIVSSWHACDLTIFSDYFVYTKGLGIPPLKNRPWVFAAPTLVFDRYLLSKEWPRVPDNFRQFFLYNGSSSLRNHLTTIYRCSANNQLCNWLDHPMVMNVHMEKVNLTYERNLTHDLRIACHQPSHSFHEDQSVARALSCAFKELPDKDNSALKTPKLQDTIAKESARWDCICDQDDQCFMFPNQTQAGCLSKIRDVLYYGDSIVNGHHEYLLFCTLPETLFAMKFEDKIKKQKFLIGDDEHERYQEVTCCTGNCDEDVHEHESVAAPGNNEIVIQ